jgi:hypothetical protein
MKNLPVEGVPPTIPLEDHFNDNIEQLSCQRTHRRRLL